MAQTALIAKTKHFPTAPFQNVFSAIFQKFSTCVAGCVGGSVCLCVTSEKAATNTGQRGKRRRERERGRECERGKASWLPTRVNIKLPKTICNFWKFCTVCCVWQSRRKAWVGGAWRRLVLQAARIPLAQIPWLLTHTHSLTHRRRLTSLLRLAVARKYATF